jgi:hypothetical protein
VNRAIVSVVGVCALLSTAAAWGADKPSKEELNAVTARGVMLAEYDQAAWHATDAVRALNPPDAKVGRYIARKTEAGWVVDFGRLDADRDRFLVAYEAVQTDAPTHFAVSTFEPERQDLGFDLAAARSIDVAIADFGSFDRPYNFAVLPAGSAGIYTYVYPAQVKVGVYPYGGDVRYLMSAGGKTIVEKHQMHKAVLESIPANVPGGTNTVGGYHSDIFGDIPEDTDVFLVLSRSPKMPEYVVARGHAFAIAIDGSIKVAK